MFMEGLNDWEIIENLVLEYQKQFEDKDDKIQKMKSDDAGYELIKRFYPLVRKYMIMIKTGELSFRNVESKMFVATFIDDRELQRYMGRKYMPRNMKEKALEKFAFVKHTYGSQSDDDILSDLHMCLLILARRYKQTGRNFCGYVYQVYRYEVSRHIKKYIKDIFSGDYRKVELDKGEVLAHLTYNEKDYIERHETYEDNMGIPDVDWIAGIDCSPSFKALTNRERFYIVKYYMEEYSDRDLADMLGITIARANTERREAARSLAYFCDISPENIIRKKNSRKRLVK